MTTAADIVRSAPWSTAPWSPRDWQARALPAIGAALREGGRPLLSAVMGAGKSILVAEVVYQMATTMTQAEAIVIGVPTQALVRQLTATLAARCGAENVGQFYGRRKQADRLIVVTCYPSAGNLAEALADQGRTVRLFVADEAHQTQTETVLGAFEALAPRWSFGVTATPYRSEVGESLELWDRVAFRYTLGDALRDGVLVPWKTVNWTGEGSDDVDEVCLQMIQANTSGPGIVSSRSIEDAENYAAFLTGRGVSALAVHSELTPTETDRRIAALKAGTVRALVHVSMLSEGVDFPWLRWLCMRRPVMARVRFAQELGRVLRCDEGKTHALLLDPHDLLGVHGIAQEPNLGEAAGDLLPEAVIGEREEPEEDPEFVAPIMPPAVAIARSTSWARHLLLVLQAHGVAPMAFPDGHWRTRRPSQTQVRTVGRMAWAARYLPEPQRAAVKALATPARASRLQRGAVSDLVSVLGALADAAGPARKAHRSWTLPEGIDLPALDAGAVDGLDG